MPAIWLDASTVRLAIVPSAFSVTTTLTGSSLKPGAEPVSAAASEATGAEVSAAGSTLFTASITPLLV